MQKIVIDTNVFVSALIQRGYSYHIVNEFSDKDDNKFLELSSQSKADFLITGNTNDFTIKRYKRTKIVTPKEYWENYKPAE